MAKEPLNAKDRMDLKDQGLWGAFLSRLKELDSAAVPRVAAEKMARDEFLGSRPALSGSSAGDLGPPPKALSRRQASDAAEIIRWVARNIHNPDVKTSDCPDPFAWTLLSDCRANPSFRQSVFIEKLWSKLISNKSESSDSEKGKIDGGHVVDIIDRVLAISEKAQGCGVEKSASRLAHVQETTGSNPVPAINSGEAAPA